MAGSIRVRAEHKNQLTQVKLLIRHPMETGLVKDKKTGQIIPAHFIKEVICKLNSKIVFTALWGIAVSTNPYLSFTLEEARPGDTLSVSWLDNRGESDSTSVTI